MRKLFANKKVKASLILVAMATNLVSTVAYGDSVSNEVSFKVGEAILVAGSKRIPISIKATDDMFRMMA